MQVGEGVHGLLPETEEPVYRLHLDADRDGRVDDAPGNLTAWTWGANGRGAIVLCNNDSDDRRREPDNAAADSRINGGNDASEIAPIVIRRQGPAPPGSWVGYLELSADDAGRARVFASRAAGAAEVLGPSAGRRYRLPDLAFTEREFGMEALRYAGAGFRDGLIRLTFTIEDGGRRVARQEGALRVAPWIMPNHLDPAERVYVVNAGTHNARFRTELAAAVTAAGCTLQEYTVPGPEGDVWIQDCMELGLSARPEQAGPVAWPTTTRAKRDRPLQTFPPTLLAPDFGYHSPESMADFSTFDAGGNLEATPPIMSGASRPYPLGRIYYGGVGRPLETFDADVKAFLSAQHVQAPFELDSSWLTVGHVDEVVTFLPGPAPGPATPGATAGAAPARGGRGFKFLIASPRRAYAILDRENAAGRGGNRMLTGRELDFLTHDPATNRYADHRRPVETTIASFLANGLSAIGVTPTHRTALSASRLRAFNERVAGYLSGMRRVFEREIGLRADEVIEVPVLYIPYELSLSRPGGPLADALTAGMVNMLVMNRHCVIPKPFGPVVGGVDLFERDLRSQLDPLGLRSTFIDDWYEYHNAKGEIHCGTNTLRRPREAPRWWAYE